MPIVRGHEESIGSSNKCQLGDHHHGGGCGDDAPLYQIKLQELSRSLGPEFRKALERNRKEHQADCKRSCELYYCEGVSGGGGVDDEADNNDNNVAAEKISRIDFVSHSMGSVPPEDLADQFLRMAGSRSHNASSTSHHLHLIKVSKAPLFSSTELDHVLRMAIKHEGLDHHEYVSGKYRLGGNYLESLPRTREWFNDQLRTTIFPLFQKLFPTVVSSTKVLRAHTASLLKYNASHPRTDVHVDNGILAFTLAMNSHHQYEGGGTYFEHMSSSVVEMDAGHATFRPGSVRHGGHPVSAGTRYVLGCFLLLEDQVEHVRRLKNRGSDFRRQGNLDEAIKHFEWALAINPQCTTCLKDLAEVRLRQRKLGEAESLLKRALELLQYKDSDALFSLGLVLSEQGGRDHESIQAYRQSLALNAEDAELCYNLAIKLGSKGLAREEMELYAHAVRVDPRMGGAWLNWGTALAEAGDTNGAEAKFLRALECYNTTTESSSGDAPAPPPRSRCLQDSRLDDQAVAAKAMLNLSLLYSQRGEQLAQTGDLAAARIAASRASALADEGKSELDSLLLRESAEDGQPPLEDLLPYARQYAPLRLRCHRLVGQLHAAAGDLGVAEAEFTRATENFPQEPSAWTMLSRVLQVQGKESEAAAAAQRAANLHNQQQPMI
jgi:tetratricopeptide (TPR) repeat protein